MKWTRLSCTTFRANAVRLQLHGLAYNLANFLRTLALPREIAQWSLTSLQEKVVKIGAKVIAHGRYAIFQMAEVAVPRGLFGRILERIARLRPPDPALTRVLQPPLLVLAHGWLDAPARPSDEGIDPHKLGKHGVELVLEERVQPGPLAAEAIEFILAGGAQRRAVPQAASWSPRRCGGDRRSARTSRDDPGFIPPSARRRFTLAPPDSLANLILPP